MADHPDGALPTLIVIGGMKCGTSALHRYLDVHPEIAMSRPKELCFFYPPPTDAPEVDGWTPGNWHRGIGWYRRHFDPDARVRGESSPGYTSPAHPGAAARMAAVVPQVRLVMLVRDPVERALSQYRHHRAEGAEHRPVDEALLDPGSQYLARSRYAERLQPFLDHFPPEQLLLVASEDLDAERRAVLRGVYAFAGAAPGFWSDGLEQRHHVGTDPEPALDASLRARLVEALRPDAQRLRTRFGLDLARWSV